MGSDAKARNEALFRRVNEKIEAVSQAISTTDPTMDFLCECDDVSCRKTVNATRGEYESVRAVPIHFIVVPDHADHGIERIIASNERFLIVEKQGPAARLAKESNPRANA
jgi:hypothetical protein